MTNQSNYNKDCCKLYNSAKLNYLSHERKFVLFGACYKRDVHKNPQVREHQNIRYSVIWMRGICFEAETLKEKNLIALFSGIWKKKDHGYP